MSEQGYTPTTEEVMRGFVALPYKVEPQREDEDFAVYLGRVSIETMHAERASEAAARRWLAVHDAEVRREAAVEALREVRGLLASYGEHVEVEVAIAHIDDVARATAIEGEGNG